ncbi:uncharacterized protein LOC105278596 [Ooceraea biroi]|uniref:uncharacterized protein LOC105278596 n=1 Tax=Ooceraea biroi TaxID=2015173 RepID=UPI000F088371|nr:uncharacterized protein LOC105278596 [Ooceraea biroi]
MPKTRRGGKKHRARRLLQNLSKFLYETPSADISSYYGVEPCYIDPEYEQLFQTRVPSESIQPRCDNNNNPAVVRPAKPRVISNSACTYRVSIIRNVNKSKGEEDTWSTRLTPISHKVRYSLCQDIPEDDPRRNHYNRLAQESKVQSWIENNQEHSNAVADPVKDGSSSASSESPTEIKSLLASADRSQRKQVLLATALVTLSSPNGRTAVVRALLDQGSEVTFVTEKAPAFFTTAVIMKNLTSYSPDHGATLNSLEYLSHVEWADPNPASSDPIDILIGADIYGDILREGLLRGWDGQPVAQNSALGWIISGSFANVNETAHHTVSVHHCLNEDSLEHDADSGRLKRSREHAASILWRSNEGPPIAIGQSRPRAENWLSSVVSKVWSNPELEKAYSDFMFEYEQLGHMRLAPNTSSHTEQQVYLPHHSVVRDSSTTTKLRVVFNASSNITNALRVLRQLVKDDGHRFPLAIRILLEEIYVDDVLFGSDDPQLLRLIRDQLIALLHCGGFELRKWASNSASLLSDLDDADHGLACNKTLQSSERLNVLEIRWNPNIDVFEFQVSRSESLPNTKRAILSSIAKLYDPLGWVTPVVISAKIFMQRLWRHNLGWDETLPDALLHHWTTFYDRLDHLNLLPIPRWTRLEATTKKIELHGFSDASNAALAAVVYLKVSSSSKNVKITLLAGKSKVAPIKPISVPRLELCAAVLLSRLICFVRRSLSAEDIKCHCWTDSTVVLTWVSQHSSRWRTFVANRVADIQSRLADCEWRYVSTDSNPSDRASRGLLGDEICEHQLWWNGPPWLSRSKEHWPNPPLRVSSEAVLEEKPSVLHCVPDREPWNLSNRYSSWPRFLQVTAYVIKFVQNCKTKKKHESAVGLPGISLSAADIDRARVHWIKSIQTELFPKEIHSLKTNQRLPSRSALLSLKPFLDNDGILRVGGRLNKAPTAFSVRHPILLASHLVVKHVIRHVHLRALHAGPQLTQTVLRRDFWILRARSLICSV